LLRADMALGGLVRHDRTTKWRMFRSD